MVHRQFLLYLQELYNGHASPRGPCVAIQLYSAIHYTAIHRYTLYNLCNTPLGSARPFTKRTVCTHAHMCMCMAVCTCTRTCACTCTCTCTCAEPRPYAQDPPSVRFIYKLRKRVFAPVTRGDTNADTHAGNWPRRQNLASYLPSHERYVHTCILTGMHLGVCHT